MDKYRCLGQNIDASEQPESPKFQTHFTTVGHVGLCFKCPIPSARRKFTRTSQ